MIVRIHAAGKSFAGTAAYLTHDPDMAQTDERVAWTHTLNLANDHVPSAVDEMLWTARNAELLKQEAGIRAGGRATENPVKHLSLNWSPEQNPTSEQMIEATQELLCHMKWQEHQAILVAHDDKSYAHVHVMLNTVHPETGLHLDDNFERRRAQAWALEYEREHGRIYCEQRLLEPAQREKSPPRNVWEEFRDSQREFERAENSLRQQDPILRDDAEFRKNQNNKEWQILKEMQRDERISFFNEGKSEFSELRTAIYREVREEFRGRWRDYYAGEDGMDPDAQSAVKAELIADQKAALESRRDEACRELREYRGGIYRELLDGQRDMRLDLRARQEAGLDSSEFLADLKDAPATEDIRTDFRSAAEATTRRDGGEERGLSEREDREAPSAADTSSGAPPFVMGAFTVFDSVLSIFEGPAPSPPPRSAKEIVQQAAEDTCTREQQAREDADDEWREKQRSPCE